MPRTLLCAILLVALTGAGCGSDEAESAAPTSGAAPAAPASTAAASTAAASADPSGSSSAAVVTVVAGPGSPVARPADPETAVPVAETAGVDVDAPRFADALDYLQLSDAAKQNFAAWVAYEIWEPSFSQGAKQDLTAGISACVWRKKGLTVTAVADLLKQEMGYVYAGATAVLRGALEALCPSLNLGFRTDFDKNVDRFAQQVSVLITFAPPPPVFYEYGFFMKAVCHAYDNPAIGRGGLRAWVRAQTDANALTLARPGAQDAALAILIEQATLVGCVNHF